MSQVLILVLMEDTLRDRWNIKKNSGRVLILVLMEDTLRDFADYLEFPGMLES